MKAIVNTAPGRLEWQERPLPVPGPGQVRIRTTACGVCATDLQMIAGWDRTGFPSIPGHEWSGRLDAVGPGVRGVPLGTPCVAENVLADGGEVGFEHPGGYGEYIVTEFAKVHPLPASLPPAAAVLIEPLAVCVRGWNRLRGAERGPALIFGDGPIGLLMTMLLRHKGVRDIVVVGGRAARLDIAQKSGARAVVNYHDAAGPLADAIRRAAGAEFPCVIEASGSGAAMAAALELAGAGAKVLAIGDYAQTRADFPWNHLLHRELELIGSNASAGGWNEAVRLAAAGTLPLERLVSRRIPAPRFAEAITLVRESRDVVKVVLTWVE